jgi:peptidyl-prolyl cis-trans isomerase SurA
MSKSLRLAVLPAALALSAPLGAEIIEQVLVKVNGDILTKTEFEQRQIAALRSRPELANGTPSSSELQKAIAEIVPDLILDAVDELLLVQRGRELNYALGDEQFKSIVDNIKKQNNIEDDARFQVLLQQEGLTMTDLRRNIERSMLVQQVQRVDINEKIGITEEETRAYYESHRADFTTPAEITLREILIAVPTTERGVNVAQDEEARARADEVRRRVTGGEPFPRMAADFSSAPSRANGGLIGPIATTDLAQPIQDILAKLTVGDVSEVLRTAGGYHILKLESRNESRVQTFEEARRDIADRLFDLKRRGEMQKYLDRLREQATITWRNEELKKAYDQALAQRRRSASAGA